jgi:hypothetical protein
MKSKIIFLMLSVTVCLLAAGYYVYYSISEIISEGDLAPSFTVDVKLTDRAKKEIAAKQASIVVSSMFIGGANENAGWFASNTGTVTWSDYEKILLKGEGKAVFAQRLIPKYKLNMIDSPNLLINVTTGYEANTLNFIQCDIYEGSIFDAAKQTINIKCDLL